MRKLVRNPVKVRIERPDYKKFRVADLGINIVENPKKSTKKPKEYTIMETTVHSNPVYSRSRMGLSSGKENNIKVMVFSQNISSSPYTCFSNGSVEACLPFEWQMTGSILSRMIVKSGRKAKQVQDEISSGSSIVEIPEGDFKQILHDAEKYGKVFNKKRELNRTVAEVSDAIDCNTLTLRYLASILIH